MGDRSRHQFQFLVLAGLFFSLHTVYLTAVPVVLGDLDPGALLPAVSVSLYAGIGLFSDLWVGGAAGRFGAPRVIRSGVLICFAGTLLLVLATDAALAVVASGILGIGSSFLISPILGGVARTAGSGLEVRTQSTNAFLQRLGALCASAFLVGIATSASLWLATLGIAGLLAAIGFVSGRLSALPIASDERALEPAGVAKGVFHLLASSAVYRVALLVNLVTPMLLIYGGAYLLPTLTDFSSSSLLAAALGGRDFFALLASLALFVVPRTRAVRALWGWSAVLGTLGLAVVPYVGAWDFVVVLCISLHGVAIASGIVLANVWVSTGVLDSQQYLGFAGATLLTRIFSLVFPLSMVFLGPAQSQWGGALVFILIASITVAVWHRSRVFLAAS